MKKNEKYGSMCGTGAPPSLHLGTTCILCFLQFFPQLKRLVRAGLLGSLAKVKLPIYEHYLVGKATRLPFGKAKKASNKFQLIHSDIYGPMNVKTRHTNYFITFIDDFTRFGHVYLISYKSEALDCFTQFTRLVENQLSTKIKALRSNRGHEYLSEQFKNFYDEKGIAR